MARSICENISGGVSIAEIIKIKTIAYLRYFFSFSCDKMPNLTSNIKNIGVRKQIPNAFSNDVVNSI